MLLCVVLSAIVVSASASTSDYFQQIYFPAYEPNRLDRPSHVRIMLSPLLIFSQIFNANSRFFGFRGEIPESSGFFIRKKLKNIKFLNLLGSCPAR